MFKKFFVTSIFMLLLITTVAVAAAEGPVGEAVYHTQQMDKYTLRVTVQLKQHRQGEGIEVTSYSISYATNTVKIFYKVSGKSGKNYIDLDMRSMISPPRIILDNVMEYNYLPFHDIAGIENEIFIRHLHDAGIINGDGRGYFRPGSTISRAEFFTMVIKSLNLPPTQEENYQFTDIQGHWAEKYILTAVKQGMVSGNGDGSIRPDDPITIGQVAVILDKAYALKSYRNGIYAKLPPTEHYAKKSIKKMLDSSVLQTTDSVYNNFNINEAATRSDCAMMLSRALTN